MVSDMGIPPVRYDGLANVEALSRARARVIDQAMKTMDHLQNDPVVTRPISLAEGAGKIINILV